MVRDRHHTVLRIAALQFALVPYPFILGVIGSAAESAQCAPCSDWFENHSGGAQRSNPGSGCTRDERTQTRWDDESTPGCDSRPPRAQPSLHCDPVAEPNTHAQAGLEWLCGVLNTRREQFSVAEKGDDTSISP